VTDRSNDLQGMPTESETEGSRAARLPWARKSPEQQQAIDRVRDWTRERFSLDAETPIMVSEVTCSLPGCPPLETIVVFWTGEDRRHHFKVFKPVQQVVPDDLPYAWLKDTLIVTDPFGCECC
jgi:nitrate reductase delta subunit